MPEFEGDEEEEKSGTTDQLARDQDAKKKKRGAEAANRRAAESDVAEGTMCCYCKGNNKLSTKYDPDPYNVVSKKGELVFIERRETQLKRNVGDVKRFIGSSPQTRQSQHVGTQPFAQPLVQQPVGNRLPCLPLSRLKSYHKKQ